MDFKRLIGYISVYLKRKYPFIDNVAMTPEGIPTFEVSIKKLGESLNWTLSDWFYKLYSEDPDKALDMISPSPLMAIPFDVNLLESEKLENKIKKDMKYISSNRNLYKPKDYRDRFDKFNRDKVRLFNLDIQSYTFKP